MTYRSIIPCIELTLVWVSLSACGELSETQELPTIQSTPTSVDANRRSSTRRDELDYGLYWFANGNDAKRYDQVDTQVASRYYDPSKSVVIYVHGWSKGSSRPEGYERELFFYEHVDRNNAFRGFVHEPWLQDGWNVGIFYWNQFADEDEIRAAEAKIWSRDASVWTLWPFIKRKIGMRYRLRDGSHETAKAPHANLTETFVNQLAAALKHNTRANIRLLGYSLGSQIVLHAADLIDRGIEAGTLNENLMPNRLTLLDPAVTAGAKGYLSGPDGRPEWIGERVLRSTTRIISNWRDRNDFCIEHYILSIIPNLVGVLDRMLPLREHTITSEVRPDHFSRFNQERRHVFAPIYYLMSYTSANPPREKHRGALTGHFTASARASNAQIQQAMGRGFYWKQAAGSKTLTLADDVFRRLRN